MSRLQLPLTILALTGLIVILASCAKLQTGFPSTHAETLAVGQQENCSECHEDQQKGTMKAYAAFSHTPAFVKNHRFYAANDDRLCSICHKSSFCADCHTNKVEMKPSYRYGYRPDRVMPHRGDFITRHKIEGKLEPASCYRCHGRADNERCSACHR